MSQVRNGLTGILKTLFFFLLGILLPSKAKRIFMMTTLHAQLVEDGVFTEETLKKLNETMDLARSDDALTYPAYFHSFVWGDQRLPDVIHDIVGPHAPDSCIPYTEAKRVGESILAMAPSWLVYGGKDEMLRDIVQLFYCHPMQTN